MKTSKIRALTAVLLAASVLLLTSCNSSKGGSTTASGQAASAPTVTGTDPIGEGELDIKYTDFDTDATLPTDTVGITLSDSGSSSSSDNVKIDGNVITVTAGGSYLLSGSLSDGRIVVDCGENEKARLCLAGASISCSDNSPIEVLSADKVMLLLVDGTTNYIKDADEGYVDSDDDSDGQNGRANAAIFSASALTVNGSGSLTVESSYNDGIKTKKTLKIIGGEITVKAVGNALKGKNAVAVSGGTLALTSDGNGIRSTEADDSTKGYVIISGGSVKITTAKHGISSEQYVIISGGTVDITTTGTDVSTDSSSQSSDAFGGRPGGFGSGFDGGSGLSKIKSKGIKAGNAVSVIGGKLTVNSTGHAISSDGTVNISGDETYLELHAECTAVRANSKGIKAEGDLVISGGTVIVGYSYEGLESKSGAVAISGGSVKITASDDGINASGNPTGSIQISGGSLFVNASGDGLDSNGNIYISGGVTCIAGPTSSGDGALDCGDSNNYISVTGGVLVAYGSVGMAEYPSADYSTQCSIGTNLTASQGTLVSLCDSDGNLVAAFVAEKNFQNVVISTPEITVGQTYTLSTGGSIDKGDTSDPVYTSGSVSGGTIAATFKIESTVTGSGGSSFGPGGRPGGNPGGRPGRP